MRVAVLVRLDRATRTMVSAGLAGVAGAVRMALLGMAQWLVIWDMRAVMVDTLEPVLAVEWGRLAQTLLHQPGRRVAMVYSMTLSRTAPTFTTLAVALAGPMRMLAPEPEVPVVVAMGLALGMEHTAWSELTVLVAVADRNAVAVPV